MKKHYSLIISVILLVILVVVMRLIPHPPNMAPISAVALLAGALMPRRWALVLPLLAIIISDLIIGFHDLIIYTWGSFALIALLGRWILKGRIKPSRIYSASIASSTLFFVITNFGVWAQGWLYPRTVQGLVDAYVMALPFYRNTLIGDLIFVSLLFGAYALIHALVPQLLKDKQKSSQRIV